MQAAIKREQAADPFNHRALRGRATGEGAGLLGVPRKAPAEYLPERAQPSVVHLPGGGPPSAPDPIEEPAVASIADHSPIAAPLESEELRGIKRFLVEEIGRIETVVADHLARNVDLTQSHPKELAQAVVSIGAAGSASPLSEEFLAQDVSPPTEAKEGTDEWSSGPIDLDEAHSRKLASQAAMAARGYDDEAVARATVPEQFIPKRAARIADAGRPSAGISVAGRGAIEAVDNDMPVFLQNVAPTPSRVAPPTATPLRRPDRSQRGPELPASVRQLLTDPMPPMRQQREEFASSRAAGSASTWGSLILAYAVFALIPITEWLSGTLDPRIGALVPAVAFMGWLSIHALRRDQIFQLRILTAWQVAHVAGGLHAIRPWGGSPAAVYWTAAAIAVAGALLVVAVSAVVETFEYRTARMQSGPRRPPPAMSARSRDAFRTPAE